MFRWRNPANIASSFSALRRSTWRGWTQACRIPTWQESPWTESYRSCPWAILFSAWVSVDSWQIVWLCLERTFPVPFSSWVDWAISEIVWRILAWQRWEGLCQGCWVHSRRRYLASRQILLVINSLRRFPNPCELADSKCWACLAEIYRELIRVSFRRFRCTICQVLPLIQRS